MLLPSYFLCQNSETHCEDIASHWVNTNIEAKTWLLNKEIISFESEDSMDISSNGSQCAFGGITEKYIWWNNRENPTWLSDKEQGHINGKHS